MRVERMEGGLLDLWVALAIGMRRSPDYPEPGADGAYWMRMGRSGSGFSCPRFTFSPLDGLAAIARFKTSLQYNEKDALWTSECACSGLLWTGVGETPLIAVGRAIVLAHFGTDPQLDTPDEPTDYDPEVNGPMAYRRA